MKCCPFCFGDSQLKSVIEKRSVEVGQCDFCKSQSVNLIEPAELQDLFSSLVDVYRKDPSGKMLVEWFREDWTMFQHEKMDNAHAKELLAEVLEDGEAVRQRFIPRKNNRSNALMLWADFRQELLFKNRFFFENQPDLGRFGELFGSLLADESETTIDFYRARIHDGSKELSEDDLCAPPPQSSKSGRANPVGIPYLYLASDPNTVVSEVRPHKGHFASVAEFQLPQNRKILDLRDPKRAVSPFLFSDEQEISRLREDLDLLDHLGEMLSAPILEDYSQVDYLPSQYLCEFAKYRGFHGVFYGSSVGPGFNLAYFDPNLRPSGERIKVFRVSDVSVVAGSQEPRHFGVMSRF